ncbi:MAG: NAD-binding protein, partial [Pseudomonadales bacterium]
LGGAVEKGGQRMTDEGVDIAHDLTSHVIIVGYGRTGHLLAALLDRQRIAHVALDLDAARVAELRAQGAPIYLGDASRAAMLGKMRLNYSAALAICTDDPGATEKVLLAARRVAPEVPIVARARDTAHATSLMAKGATRVVLEVMESGLQLGHVMLEEMGLPANVARDLIDAQRVQAERALRPESRT